jgi:carboxyl-terminal processing protease
VRPVNDERKTGGTPLRWGHTLLTLLLVALVFVVGVWVGGHPRQIGLDRLPTGLRDRLVDEDRTALATQVLAILQQDYYKPIDKGTINKIENGSVASLVKELGDPYTQYLDPDQYKLFQADRAGKYGGIGVEWHPQGDTALITKVFPDEPAAKAGLLVADRVVAVDGKKVLRADGFAAMAGVKGEEGTKVTLRIARDTTKERDYVITREEIRRQVVESRVEVSGTTRVGYVRLDQFTDGSSKAFRSAVRRLTEEKISGLVFDLRGDGGGLVDEAVGIASVFLPEGALIATTRARRGPREELKARGDRIDPNLPLVVLVNRDSASASEIVAGALKDAGRARLVGTRTFGKALIQSTRSLANGGAIKFTVASYLTPKGFDLGTKGLPPDVTAEDDPKTLKKDEALAKALETVVSR